ncbi:hypothetical protein [Pseudomonas sp. EL_65y_Pfl2_R95]|uniref:hypothetical protein n=1 Tax=Pseudomonas sp. EL_65y_Pfl2_R95 TaxID=3088698 RepID=UPI0030D78153
MPEKIIIALVVVVTLAAHYWLYRWVKFKIDEGVVLKCLGDATSQGSAAPLSTQAIAQQTQVKLQRVAKVCQRSPKIQRSASVDEAWQLS